MFSCVIWTMCIPNLEFQLINPTTQVALYTICNGNCSGIENITWNVYNGSMSSSVNETKWTLFDQINLYENIWFFGRKTSNFTATNDLFIQNSSIQRWKFEVIYKFSTETSVSALNFIINEPPQNGSCSISPENGTTSMLFTISCQDWFDKDDIKDYSYYIWIKTPMEKLFLGSSLISEYEVRLPSGDEQTSRVNLIVLIRDQLDCVREYNLSSITVQPDLDAIENLITNFQTSSSNSIVELLTVGNQNTIGQVLTSVSQQINKISEQTMAKDIPIASIAISSLDSQRLPETNQSQTNDFEKQLNSLANIREFLIPFATNLQITTSNSIKLQASTLAQLTQTTNQLTRQSLILVSEKCLQLSLALQSMSLKLSYEDVQTTATSLIQCATNILTVGLAFSIPFHAKIFIL